MPIEIKICGNEKLILQNEGQLGYFPFRKNKGIPIRSIGTIKNSELDLFGRFSTDDTKCPVKNFKLSSYNTTRFTLR